MTKHDEVRQILHDTGFKFGDGRTALDMTDEEVEKFVIAFMSRMAKIGREMTRAFETITVNLIAAVQPMQDLGRVLAEDAKTHRGMHGA